MSEDAKTYSVVYRLQRVTTEFAHVSVPVTAEVMQQPDAEGNVFLDADRVLAGALGYAADPDVKWIVESCDVSPHPLQTPVPEGYPLKNQWHTIHREGKGTET